MQPPAGWLQTEGQPGVAGMRVQGWEEVVSLRPQGAGVLGGIGATA